MEAVQLEVKSAHPPCAGDGTAGPGFTLGSHLPQVMLKKNKIRKKTFSVPPTSCVSESVSQQIRIPQSCLDADPVPVPVPVLGQVKKKKKVAEPFGK